MQEATISVPTPEPERCRCSVVGETAIIALAFATVVTACGWFVAGKSSPINHGLSPDVHDRPLLMLWVVANSPAGILFVGLFSKHGSVVQYFFCVFVQWLVVGIACGLLMALARKRTNTHEHPNA